MYVHQQHSNQYAQLYLALVFPKRHPLALLLVLLLQNVTVRIIPGVQSPSFPTMNYPQQALLVKSQSITRSRLFISTKTIFPMT